MVHAQLVPRQKPLGLKRNGGKQEETEEAEEELYKETRSGNGCKLAWTCSGEFA
jgi:hypothetical protein